MKRRTFIKTSGLVAAGGLTGLAGCTSGNNSPPPRKSNVIEKIEISEDGSTLTINPVPDNERWVQTRRDIDDGVESNSLSAPAVSLGFLSGLSPVGVASAAKGRGATGRGAGGYSSAPKTSGGRAWFWGGAYANSWYDDHDDEIEQYAVDISTLGIAYIGTNEEFEEQDPGPGPVSWDETHDNPDDPIEANVDSLQTGWYRVGANIVTNGTDLGWECIDLRVEDSAGGKEITERWKVSPRI